MSLAWYRSWPCAADLAELHHNTPRVIDRLPRLVMANQNYATVPGYQPWPTDWPGFCLLEWDVALDPWGMLAFAAEALVEPRRVLVAPYRFHDTWIDWNDNDGGGPGGRPVTPDDDQADSFGLGCIYFPRDVLREFLADMDHTGFTDGSFGRWHHRRYGPVRVTWRVHPQHLHEWESPP